jgi:neutral ceramidase
VKADKDYVEHVTRGIVSALYQASENLVEARIGWGSCQVAEEVNNRRWYLKAMKMPTNPFGRNDDQVRMNPPRGRDVLDRPAGPVDPEVMFLSVTTPEGRPIALLANYSLHYVGGIPAGGVSADYFGEFARQLEQRLFPEGHQDALRPFVGIMSNGTSGDINNIRFADPRPRKKPFEQMRHVASLVAERVVEALPDVEYRSEIELAMAQSELTLDVRKPTEERVQQAKEFLDASDESKLPPRAKSYAQWTMMLDEHQGTEELVLQALRIGDVGITAIPCEVLVEIGLRLKENSPLQPSFTIELANGHYGYLPDPRQHRLGGYETWLGTNILELEASDKIEEELLRLLGKLSE